MATVQDDFAAIDEGVWELGRSFDPDSWKEQHDQAMWCREFETRIANNLPVLQGLLTIHQHVFEVISSGLQFDDDKRRTLRLGLQKGATMVSYLLENVGRQIAVFENSGYAIAGSGDFQSLLRSSQSNLATILERLDDVPHSSNGEAPQAGVAPTPPFDIPVSGEQIRIKPRLGAPLLPDPPFETGEGPPPFDLPRPGGGKVYRVKVIPGLIRLPDPIDD